MQYHYYLYGMRVTADLDFVQLDPVRLPEDDRDFGREKVRIRAMDEEEEAQFRKEHGDCVCGSFLGTEKGWLCNRTLAMSVERGQVIRYHIRKGGDPGAVRTYLLGFGIAMLSIQQGKLPIHGSALATPEGGAILSRRREWRGQVHTDGRTAETGVSFSGRRYGSGGHFRKRRGVGVSGFSLYEAVQGCGAEAGISPGRTFVY